MKTCGNCKYRGETITRYDEKKFEDVPTNSFLCDRIKHINGDHYRYGEDMPMPPGEIAGVQDGSGYYAALCVTDDFGCVLWEGK